MAALNTTRLCGNNASCTIAFGCQSNIPFFISKQIVFGLTLADFQVPIMFKGKHIRFCDYLPHSKAILSLAGQLCQEDFTINFRGPYILPLAGKLN
jgi:hypothetical protein